MKELVRCKSCGYIMEKGRLHGKCPACGVPEKMFEPYTEKIAPFRKFVLSLDLHPVLVHFPQAFAVTILLLSLFALVASAEIHERISGTIAILGGALPFVVMLAFLSGLFDGKIRFRRVNTPLLVRKMIFGVLFFCVSCAIAWMVVFHPSFTKITWYAVAGLSLAGVGCGAYLGMLGSSLINAKFPG
jgi:uncharacterized membrane protein/rubredoxin